MEKINEELHNLYSSPNTTMVIKWEGHAPPAERQGMYIILVTKPEWMRPLHT
jgi:hypothetical protein